MEAPKLSKNARRKLEREKKAEEDRLLAERVKVKKHEEYEAKKKADEEAARAKEYVIGIDLGTTFSCVAVCRNGAVEVLADTQGDRTTPSWVSYDADGMRCIGKLAQRQSSTNPTRTLFNIKRIIGRQFTECYEDVSHMPFEVTESPTHKRPEITIQLDSGKKKLAPEQVSAAVLEHMKSIAERALGEPVRKAVITVPAYFNDAQRRLTKDAGLIAGLEVLRIINEPTAAALAYGLNKCAPGSAPKKVLVFDLGGGTFDVSLLEIDGGVFEVLATAGDTHLGGEDFDSVVSNFIIEQYKQKNGAKDSPFSGDGPEVMKAKRRLRTACERAKRELSDTSTTLVETSCGGKEICVELTRAKFNSLNEKNFQRCLESVKRVLADAKCDRDNVDEVVLVGGSTRVPRVQEILREYFGGKELCRSVNPDEAVAYGAAIQGAILSGQRDPLTREMVLIDITPLSLGVGCVNNKFVRVVPRNTQIPCRIVKDFTTVENFQTEIDIDVVEGESPASSDNHLLGSFEIKGVERAKAGEAKIDVAFEVNTDGMLKVTAKDRVTGAVADVEIKHDRGRLTAEEIDQMCVEAELQRQRQAEQALADGLELESDE